MSKVKSIFKRSLAILLAVLTIMSVGLTSVIALNLDMAQTAGYVDLAETGANTTVSDGSYRLYFKFSGGSTWWNGSGCYHFAWVFGTNMTSQYRAIYKVGTTNNASTGNTSDVFYMDIPSGTLTGMILFRAKAANSFTNGGTTWIDGVWHNKTNDITISNNIGTYNLVTAVTENSGSITQNSRYTDVSVSSSGATVTNAQSGSGTTTDPYIVTPGQTMNVSATSSIADHNFKVGYGYNSSTQYTTTATGTVTASTTTGTTKSFTVYYTPLLNGSTSYKGTQTSKTIYYKAVDPVVTPATPAPPTVEFPDSFGGTGTHEDPFLVEPKDLDSKVKMNVYGELGDADGLAYNVNYYGSKVDWAVGVEEKIGYEDLNAPALDETIAVNTYLWAYNVDGNTKKYSDNYATTTLYIKGAYKNATVTFKNGTATYDTQTVAIGDTPTTPTPPTKTGYTFQGWSLTDGGTVVTVEDQEIEKDTTFYAVWKAKTYTIAYLNDDGSTLGRGSADYGTKVNVFNNAPTATKAPTAQYEYAFKEWVYENGTPVGTNDTVTGNITLKASYTETTRSYTVNYSGANGTVSVAYANGTVVPSGSAVPYGTTLTLTATPDKFYNVGTWKANGSAVTGTTYTVTGNVELVHTFGAKPSYEVTIHQTTGLNGTVEAEADDAHDFAFDRMYQENGWVYKAEAGATVTFTVTAPNGYYIKRANMVNYTVDDTTVSFTVENVNVKTDISVIYEALPTYNVTVSANNTDAGTVTGGNDAVIYGNKVNLTATPNEGYRFVNWTVEGTYSDVGFGDTLAVTSLIPQSNLTITANFVANSGIINVTAGEGGTVTNTGTHNVTYPNTVTATATPNESEGYQFTHWTVESAGKVKNVDYKVTENDNVITVQILTQGTEVNVTANFANAQNIKVYTYSDSGFNRLTMTESNGTTTNTPVNNVTQSPVTFGKKTWYTPGEVSLTPGFNTSITAQLFGDNPLAGGTGTLIMFNNTLGWSEVYMFASCSWHDIETNGYGGAIPKDATDQYTMSNIKGTNYWYAYVSDLNKFDTILFVNTNVSGWGDMNSGQKASYRGDAISNVTAGRIMFTPSTSVSATGNGTPYYNSGSWGTKPTDVKSETGIADIVNELYDGNTWKGLDEIWIYIKSNGTYIATTKDRRELIDEVNSALMKRTYNNGVNDMEYTSSTWTAFVSAYEAAITASGDPTLNNTQLEAKHSALTTAYNNLKTETNVRITGSHGAEPHTSTSTYYGKTSFPGITPSTGSGNIGDNNDKEYYDYPTSYIYATIVRGTTITINTNVESAYEEDYLVYGWVVNGTEWVPATQDITDTSLYVGTYKCEKSAIIVPIYFRKDTIANWETDDSIIKIYANTEGASDKWGNYISAYTWMNPKNYYQFGHWTGQLMIPDTANPGMYYTFIETNGPSGQKVSGIAFTNYGNNTPINTNDRYQTYDYYEFIELAEQGYNNIVFKLKTFEGNNNSPKNSKETLSNYVFDYFRDFSGNLIDINREKIVEERTIPDPALYIIRTGPVVYNNSTGQGWGSLEGSDFYVDAYLYKPDGTYIGRCKTYELTNLEKLAKPTSEGGRDIDLTTEEYAGKPVMVDYASLTSDSGGNKRFDGEWFGTKYGLTNVTIKTEVAFQNEKGEIQYFQGQNNVDGVGQAYFNGEHFQEVSHGSENHTINAIVAEGNDFVGWYKAIVADDGTYTIDATAKPLFIERSVSTIDASADAVYVAVFKEHPEGTFTVNNYYYTYDDFKGQPMGEHLPHVFGGDTSYSIRDVRINKIKDYQGNTITNGDKGFAGTYTQSYENISAGDVLEITIKTTPTYTQRDYVYAWYIQVNEADGKVNFEEVGTNVIQDNYVPGASKEFTFTYTVEEGVNNITIYSDVVHITPEVTFTYIYNNRYNETRSYVVKHTLTDAELQDFDNLKNNKEFMTKIHNLAPYVGDIYKNVTWEIENISSDATNWTLRASEADVYTVNVNVNGTVMEPPVTGRFNDTVSLYAKDIDDNVTGNKGIWYLNNDDDPDFDAAVDEILGYGTYYGLVITGDADVYFTSVDELINQIILADAVYGYERATDGSGSVTTNKVYVDYLISMLLNVYTGGYIDINGNGKQDSNEPTVIDEENTNTPVSLKAISDAGYVVDYGMIHELLNTFGDNSDDILAHYYKSDYKMDNAKLTAMLKSGSGVAEGESYEGALATYFYHYSAIDYKDYATNKNRVIMTFGFDNNDFNRSMFYNVKAYLTISVPGTTTINDTNTMFVFSNQATLNIAEADKITNGEATNS